jgi:eukaryotic-like serine/threonine-protein kinase
MGTVYEAEEAASGRRVALKLISPQFATSGDAVDRFRQEGRLASMISHPHCVFVLAADEQAGHPYIAMELMPGATLQDLVRERGPLPVEEAVTKILEVIEGLQEAHRLGVIHRDVKPSNCFVDGEGRIKIGDFGLAKSLTAGQDLTKSGSFLGTVLYASREQIKAERVDQQTDIYSVAATLYFLLTGRAPFQSRDAAATVARVVSDAPPSMRARRPEIPPTLDRIVRRGLERQRQRRWRTLDDLQAALLPFVTSELSAGSPGMRIAAFLIDKGLFWPLATIAHTQITNTLWPTPDALRRLVVFTIPWFLYFIALETLWGCSLGKRWLRLRVYSSSGNYQPGLKNVLPRTLFFYILVYLPSEVLGLLYGPRANDQPLGLIAYGLAPALGVLVLAAPMRLRNGYRGIHELLSGTRVVRLPWAKKRRAFPSRPLDQPLLQPDGLPDRVGSFRVQGALCWTPELKILVAQDAALGRQAWIYLRPLGKPALNAARRAIHRPTRLRWLACGKYGEWQWDAFFAPAGCPLQQVVKSEARLSWPDARALLEQLTAELAAACQDKTLPRSLTVDRVWIQANGRVQLLDASLDDFGDTNPADPPDQKAGLLLLRQVAELTLEGRVRRADEGPAPIRAPVPKHAAPMLNRLLLPDKHRFRSVDQFGEELAVSRNQPPEVTTAQRAAHLALLTTALFFPLVIMFVLPCVYPAWVKVFGIFTLELQNREEQRVLSNLHNGMACDCISSLLQPDALGRAYGLARLHADMHLAELIREKLDRDVSLENGLRQSAGWIPTFLLSRVKNWVSLPEDAFQADGARDFRKDAMDILQAHDAWRVIANIVWVVGMVCVVPFAVIWTLWAFLMRGGFTFRLAGIALLRSNGRKALRIQCAWRALLVWTPVTALLVLSVWLDSVWLAAWFRQSTEPHASAYWLSWLCWGSALALLPLYVGLALRLPNRSLHDRLAGTYLVPR